MSARAQRTLWAAALAAYFWYFVRDSIGVKFAPDDLMNLDYYWRLGWGKMLASLVAPWLGGYRPIGGLFYLPLLRVFGLNPAPFHAAMLVVLALNVWLVYRLARALGRPELASGVAAFLACYHAGLSFLYYNTSFIYDALCTFFYLAALGFYIRCRSEDRTLSRGEMAVFLALYWFALNSKEMALTMPGVLIAYEWLFAKRRSAAGVVGASLLAAPILMRAFLGPGALATIPIYRPEFSWTRVAAFHTEAMSDLFLAWHFFTPARAAAVWAALTAAAWWPKRPALRFCWWFLVLTPIPIELLEGRTNACLELPYSGLAILAATVLVAVARAAADHLRRPILRRAVLAGTLAAGMALWAVHNAQLKRRLIVPQMRALGEDTWAAISELRRLHPAVRAHSTVIFLNDPFDDFDMAFIADLCFLQPDLNIKLARKTPAGQDELAKADHLFGYQHGRLVQLR